MKKLTSYGYCSDHDLPALEITKYMGNSEIVKVPRMIDGMEVRKIGERSFEGNNNVKLIILPGTVSVIGNRAFHGCSQLREIRLPRRLIELPEDGFSNTALREVVIPNRVTSIGKNAFASCPDLEIVIFEKKSRLKQIHGSAFCFCNNLKAIIFP